MRLKARRIVRDDLAWRLRRLGRTCAWQNWGGSAIAYADDLGHGFEGRQLVDVV
jgi:hypothetical protein